MLRVLPLLLAMKIRSRMEYRASFFIDAAAMILTYGSVYATFWVLLLRFGTLAGWDWPELAVLLSFQLFTYALGRELGFADRPLIHTCIGALFSTIGRPRSPCSISPPASDANCSRRSPGRRPYRAAARRAKRDSAPWLTTTPLGRPVEPDV